MNATSGGPNMKWGAQIIMGGRAPLPPAGDGQAWFDYRNTQGLQVKSFQAVQNPFSFFLFIADTKSIV